MLRHCEFHYPPEHSGSCFYAIPSRPFCIIKQLIALKSTFFFRALKASAKVRIRHERSSPELRTVENGSDDRKPTGWM